jgi:hypothetical protein
MFESVVLMSVMFFVIILNKPQKGVQQTFLFEIYHSFNQQSLNCSDYQVILKEIPFGNQLLVWITDIYLKLYKFSEEMKRFRKPRNKKIRLELIMN